MKTNKSTKAVAVLAGLAGAASVVMPAQTAQAHGGMTFPATRTYACYKDGLAWGGGDLNPSNRACVDAIAVSGKTPLWNWFGNLISNAGGRHQEIIPDGNLCGPQQTFAGYRLAHPDWPKTQLTAGADITFRYNAWAPHPGTWYQYVTKDGWNPNEPLGWDDLEPVPFDQVTNPPINGSGPDGAEYTWNATLPEGKSGYHIIYSIWQRSDSPEAFYNCSDVVFN
ncbi:lytic polysaccharide monooxygenase auxiliary activity family 9 protein [Allostreptomyces psammosilenae]|uniref:Putative carbohydrate-binding protein with CBM5 and CBM33 domain n=1 Tax=Allostreptomyces psammosilenae TaxID=1892865 RepID=A0A852ZRM9_9ACTN|nr:lytic polysaccharide monooxygenase [Allostreptomyces psammosilenae]NYI05043.1 putative carbohydrate-binding protein with CBM5 and CBM33 domain [Allostreptomyces psammosilenae]